MAEAATAMGAVFSTFAKYFKLSRSPYLLSGILCVFAILSMADIREARSIFFLGFIPCGAIFSFLAVLCFYFKPSESQNMAEAAEEIDEQFKFSRTFCIGTGVLLLTYLLYKLIGADFFQNPIPLMPTMPSQPIQPGLFFYITYVLCLIHLSIFSIYTLFRTIKEEDPIQISLFQITFFTVAVLWGVVYSCTKIHDQHQLIDTCPDQLTYKDEKGIMQSITVFGCRYEEVKNSESARIKMRFPEATDFNITQSPASIYDANKIVFWYFLIHVIAFESYWVRRLVRAVEFKFKVRDDAQSTA
jgi:hypothetical protein